MNKILVCLILAFSSYNLISKNSFFYKPIIEKTNKVESEWKTEYKDNFVLIESKVIVHESKADGTNHERVIFRYTNLTDQPFTLLFNRSVVYNGVCYGCSNADKKYSVRLNSKEIKEFSALNKDKTYYIFSKDLKGTIKKTLESFQLTNIEKN